MSFAWHEIRDQLIKSSSTLGFQRNFDTIRCTQGLLAQFRDPAALLDGLHRCSDVPERKNLILSALVVTTQGEGRVSDCALTLLLLALWPGLDAVRRRLAWRRIGTADEITSELLARTTEAIRGLDLQRVNWVAATVIRNVERDALRAHRRESDRQGIVVDADPDEVVGDHAVPPTEHSHARLHRDIRRLIGGDATLVMRAAVEGFSHVEIAAEFGLSEAAARKRYQRAVRKLREALPEIV